MDTRSGLGACTAFGLLLAVALNSCGRALPRDEAAAGQPGCEDQDCAGAGPSSSGGSPDSGQEPSAGAGAAHEAGGAPSHSGGAPAGEACDPGTRVCDGPSVRLCSDDGQSSTIEETCSLSQVCSSGACVDIACVPGKSFCGNGQVLECNDSGTSGSVVETCAEGQFCLERAGAAECSDTACVPEEGLCLNQVATTCRADGSGPAPGGKNCAAQGLVCDAGNCVDPTCAPGEKLCEHDDVYLCVGGGADAVLFTDCQYDEVCDPALAACRKRLCDAGTLGCDANRVAKCDSLGLSWEKTGTDCTTSNNLRRWQLPGSDLRAWHHLL